MSTVLVLSGCSTKDTLKTYAYLPTMVLNGVGDIASIAKAKEEFNELRKSTKSELSSRKDSHQKLSITEPKKSRGR